MKIIDEKNKFNNPFLKKKNFKMNFLNSKIYQKKHFLKNLSLNNMEFFLKNGLKIIYHFHMQNKKIMFVGFPLKLNKKLSLKFKKTNHIFMPQLTWSSGEFTNYKKTLSKKSARIKVDSNKSILLRKTPDLVVIIDSLIERKALKECFLEKFPVIALNSDLNPFSLQISYHIPGNFICFQNRIKNNFFYSILCSILLKNKKTRKIFLKYNKRFFQRKKFYTKNYKKPLDYSWSNKNSYTTKNWTNQTQTTNRYTKTQQNLDKPRNFQLKNKNTVSLIKQKSLFNNDKAFDASKELKQIMTNSLNSILDNIQDERGFKPSVISNKYLIRRTSKTVSAKENLNISLPGQNNALNNRLLDLNHEEETSKKNFLLDQNSKLKTADDSNKKRLSLDSIVESNKSNLINSKKFSTNQKSKPFKK